MPEDQIPETEIADDAGVPQSPGWDVEEGSDDFLGQLVAIATAGVAMGITLSVGGSAISGTLCSGKEYFAELRKIFAASWKGGLPDFVDTIFDERIGSYNKEDEVFMVGFIHLRDAKIWNGGQQPLPSNTGVLWRGRLSAVDGWSLGSLSAD